MGNAGKLIFPPIGCCGYGWCKIRILVLVLFVLGLDSCQRAQLALDASGAGLPAATLVFPVGSEPVNPFTPFRWQPVSGATGYYLQVGTALGLQDVFAVGELPPNINSWAVDNLLPGAYYARLYTHSAAGWAYQDLPFNTVQQSVAIDPSTLYTVVKQQTARVRMSANDANVPISGSALAAEVAGRQKKSADCTDFAYTLIELLQEHNIYSRSVVITLDGTYTEGHTTVEYYDPFLQKWSVADPTFGVFYFDYSLAQGQSAAELNQYVVSESWSLIKPRFVTPNGNSYLTGYYMDPITLYLNLVPQGSTPPASVTHDPRQFLLPFSSGVANPHGYYLFGFGADSESLQLNNPQGPYTADSGTLTIATEDPTTWSSALTLNDNWSIVSAPSGTQAYTFRRVLF
jgi:hypothetical protein